MHASQLGFNPEYSDAEPSIEQIHALTGSALLEFGAPWCGHCQAARPSIEQALAEHPSLMHIKVYDNKGKPLGRAFKVKLWPTLILLQDGKEVERIVRPVHVAEVADLLTST